MTIDDKVAGAMTISIDRRSARMELSTERRQTVPAIAVGSTVSIVDQDGNVLMSGKF